MEFSNKAARSKRGFTLVELLVVVMVIGIIAAIIVPNVMVAQKKSKLAAVKDNMHTVQIASEAYGLDLGGMYSNTASALQPYYPGGSNMSGGGTGRFAPNPFTPGTNDDPADGSTITSVQLSRSFSPGAMAGNPGQVNYCQVQGLSNQSYGIVGMDDLGHSVGGMQGKQLVLSNQ